MSEIRKQQTLILDNRAVLSLSGVEEVGSFSENALVIYTCLGVLSLKGSNLKIKNYSVETGDLLIDGKIDSLVFSDQKRKNTSSLVGKLFR